MIYECETSEYRWLFETVVLGGGRFDNLNACNFSWHMELRLQQGWTESASSFNAEENLWYLVWRRRK